MNRRHRLRSRHKQFSELFGTVVQLDVVGDEIPVEVRDDRRFRVRDGLHPDRMLFDKHENVPQHAALDARHERFASVARLEPVDVVRAEVVQKRRAIAARQFDLRAVADVEQRCGTPPGIELGNGIAEMQR